MISGIPMVTMPLGFQRAIIEQSFAALGPGGCLLQYSYSPIVADPGQEARRRGPAGASSWCATCPRRRSGASGRSPPRGRPPMARPTAAADPPRAISDPGSPSAAAARSRRTLMAGLGRPGLIRDLTAGPGGRLLREHVCSQTRWLLGARAVHGALRRAPPPARPGSWSRCSITCSCSAIARCCCWCRSRWSSWPWSRAAPATARW